MCVALNSETKPGFTPQNKPVSQAEVRKIVKQELETQKKLEDLKAQYEAGEISKLDYASQKFFIEAKNVLPYVENARMYSTTA